MKIKIFIVSLFCFLMCGCWNYNELSDLAIVTGIGIDSHEEGIKLSLMISNSQSIEASDQNESQTTVTSGVGSNLNEALVNIEMKNPKKLYLGHLAVAVIDEKLAQKGLGGILDALIRNPESAKKYPVVLARENKAEDILKSLSPLEAFPSQNISLNIQTTAKNQGISNNTILSVFLSNILKQGSNATLPSISIQGDEDKIDNQDDLKETEPKAMLKSRSLGLFKNAKLVAWTTEKESQGINIINNSIGRIFITNKYENNDEMVVLIDNIKCKTQLTFQDKPIITLNIEAEGAIIEVNFDTDLEKPNVIKDINKKTAKSIKNLVNKGIDVAKKHKTDVFGFGNMIYQNNPKYWSKIKKDWDDQYLHELEIKANIKVNVKSKGSLETTIKEKINES